MPRRGGLSYREAKGGDVQPALSVFKGWYAHVSPTARNSSLTRISEPHDLPFSSHISCTLITDTQSQSRNNSLTVEHRKLRPSPETDPLSAANYFGGSLTI